jgi:hypothetical protein
MVISSIDYMCGLLSNVLVGKESMSRRVSNRLSIENRVSRIER